jgi:membrane-anchored protein YejM (alkaline phosphatase superfamily)
MSTPTPIDTEALLEKLSQAVADWEDSPYYRKDEELFDLERFLLDYDANAFKAELEKIYGQPLNEKFWSSSLAYQRLKRAREVVKNQDDVQDKKRQDYARAVEEGQKEWRQWLKEIRSNQLRSQLKVIPGGKKELE